MRARIVPALLILSFLLPPAARAQQAIHWQTTLDGAKRLAAQSNQLVLIHFWAPWCGACRQMEQEVFTQPSVIAAVGANYVPVKLNAEFFPATAQQYGVSALPSDVITTPQGQLLQKFQGLPRAQDYVASLNQVAAASRPQAPPVYAQVPAPQVPSQQMPSQQASGAQVPGPQVPAPQAQASAPQTAAIDNRMGATQDPASRQPQASPAVSDNRYADYYRQRSPQAAPVVPSYGSPAVPPASQPQFGAAGPNAPVDRSPLTGPVPTASQPAPAAASTATQPQARYAATAPSANPAAAPSAPAVNPAQPQTSVGPRYAPQAQAQPASQPLAPASQPSAATPPKDAGYATASTPPTQTAAQAGNPPLGLDGYCPVRLVEKQQWSVGDSRWGVIHRGRTYLFAGQEEQKRFLANPDNYAPVMAGLDVVIAVERRQTIPGSRAHGGFYGNRVYLFADEESLEKFTRDPDRYVSAISQALRPAGYTPYR